MKIIKELERVPFEYRRYLLSDGSVATIKDIARIINDSSPKDISEKGVHGRIARMGLHSPRIFLPVRVYGPKGKAKPVVKPKPINRGEFDRTIYCFRYHQPCKKYVDCLNEGYTAAKKAWPEVLGCFKSDERTERIHGNQS